MAPINTKRTRSERVASLQMEPSELSTWLRDLLTGAVLLRIGSAFLAAVAILLIQRGWEPAFSFREGDIPQRAIVARVPFDLVDVAKTAVLRDQQRRDSLCYYENHLLPQSPLSTLSQLQSDIKQQLLLLLGDQPYADLSDEQKASLARFLPKSGSEQVLAPEDALRALRSVLTPTGQSEKFDEALRSILNPIAEYGILKSLGHDTDQGNQRSIKVIPTGQPKNDAVVDVTKVRFAEVSAELPQKTQDAFQAAFTNPDSAILAKMVANFLIPGLEKIASGPTLVYRQDLSEEARKRAEASVEDAIISYSPMVSTLARPGQPMSSENDIPLLRAEHDAWIKQLSWGETVTHGFAFLGMVMAMYMLCGFYIYFQFDRTLITDPIKLTRLLGLVVVVFLLCRLTTPDPWRAEVVPIVLCAMTATIAFGKQVALLITCCLALCFTLSSGYDMAQFVMLCSGACASALLLGRIRTRTKLIYVGLGAGIVVAATHFGADMVIGRLHVVSETLSDSTTMTSATWLRLLPGLSLESIRLGGVTLLAGALMTGLLPFVERIFGVQTDLSLLELGDASHPLLRQLAQRAPGTYNHSINVAAIAEAAADSIGAHGLLTRVGAYFHDIGKMFKPNYFVENQGQAGNCHDTLQPAMSTLVIIAHVKDGADLARQHHLPKPITDFIEQHHGTTLVEHFYREATKRSQSDPNKEEVSETSFRYPGPKPQTREAAVLMLADSVESASRSLVEPTSSRLQNLVDQLAMKKLLDGQFDECGLTLQQLDLVKNSLVKSLTAIYHGRVKYTGQQTA
ncbi:MAG: HDIG domain-containing protein [Pirellulaceae bacterium]|nr:HDIG domain-containing protein [Pirellulaceae bacterium]